LDLLDFLKEIGFKEGACAKCLFNKEIPDGSKLHLLNYVDDMLYYGTDMTKVQEFEQQLSNRFTLELLGNAHWYLGSRINQSENFDIKVDQSSYCKAIVKRYFETAGCAKNIRHHDMPLPSGFVPTTDDCAPSEQLCMVCWLLIIPQHDSNGDYLHGEQACKIYKKTWNLALYSADSPVTLSTQ
jgi:hypothetical protein